ncbi:MAG: heavy metal sensor histidine kinase [Elusimicrobiota bacterium]
MYLKPRINSVRFKITLWYTFTLLIALSIFGIFLYDQQKNSLSEHTDELLALKAESLADTIETILKEEIKEKDPMTKKDFRETISYLMNEHLPDPGLTSLSVRIIDFYGKEILKSANIANIPPISSETLGEIVKGGSYYETLSVYQEDGKNSFYRSYSTPVQKEGKTAYIIQVFRPLDQNQFAMKTLLKNIFIFIPVTAFLTAILGMTIAGLALKPVHDIIKTTKQINAESLHLRIVPPKSKDEIRELADLFNEMISRLEESFISQKRFIQDASHELKTPLTILKGEMEVALKKTRSPVEYEKILKSNLEETERLTRLVENLLTLARLDNKEIAGQKSILELNEILKQTAQKLYKKAKDKNIEINLKLSDKNFQFKANEDQISRAFSNIIENAVKYSPEGSPIEITSRLERDKFIVSVKDKGPGIPPESLPHIFERFYRADASRSTEGFGLGLAIAKASFENYGAFVTASNIKEGGACFIVEFPIS